jgi:hypothetical protein
VECILPAVAVKVAVLDPFGTVTLPGVVSELLLSLIPTAAPDEEAAVLSETVQVVVLFELSDEGLQLIDDTVGADDTVNGTCRDEPFNDPVTVAA